MEYFDKYGVEFSEDLKTLVRCPEEFKGEYTIPNNVTKIGDNAFEECTKLTSIIIPGNVTNIGDGAFCNCDALTNVAISNGVKRIGYDAFSGCSALTSITIPESVTDIEDGAFSYCHNLINIVVEKGNIYYDSRDNCNAIIDTCSDSLIVGCQNTIIPKSITRIGDHAFFGHSNLTSIIIPDNITSIGDEVFGWCYELSTIIIPNSVTEIGDYAFSYCESLTQLTIPQNVNHIGHGAFYRCNGLTSIVVDHRNTYYDSRDNCNAIIETESNTIIAGCKNTVIPDGITKIGKEAFADCKELTDISIPNSVTCIGEYAFWNCQNLNNVILPNSITKIEGHAFEYCYNFTQFIIPNSVKTIGEWVLYGCSGVTSLTIPNSVTSIDKWAFMGCSKLTNITVESGNANYDSQNNCNAIIETSTNKLIKGCKNTIIPDGVIRIGNYAFGFCKELENITIPKSVKYIEDSVFSGCRNLRSIRFESKTPPKILKNVFLEVSKSKCTLYVPEKSMKKYKATEGLTDFQYMFAIFEWSKTEEQILIRMYKNDFSYSAIAKALGCRKQEVLDHLVLMEYLTYDKTDDVYRRIK